VGGIGGRLVMLVIRLQSDGAVRGLVTDDGFTIGRFTTATAFLLTVTAGLGAATGIAYLLLRRALPRRGRALGWGLVVGLVTGADILKPGSFDFAALDSKPFIVASFALLPLIAAYGIALAIERLLEVEPWSRRELTAALGLGALPLLPALPIFAILATFVWGARRLSHLTGRLHRPMRIGVPLTLSLVAANSGIELWLDALEIL
jgi:hypothetical protein